MKKINGMMLGMVLALVLLASGVGAEATALSGETLLDTRTHTVDWSDAGVLNTREIVGTTIIIR